MPEETVSEGRQSWPFDHSRNIDFEPGSQVGVHAKMRPSFEVIEQALERGGSGPHYGVVAIPKRTSKAFKAIAQCLGIGVLEEVDDGFLMPTHPRLRRCEPMTLPPFASRSIVAGSPSPRSLSPWRIKALKFLAWARQQPDGQITALDVERFGIHRSFADRWMVRRDFVYRDMPKGGVRKVQAYALTPDQAKLPDCGYEGVAAELAAHLATEAA